jgi:hypothetical protein
VPVPAHAVNSPKGDRRRTLREVTVRTRAFASLAAAAVLAGGSWNACSVYDSSLLLPLPVEAGADADVDGSSDVDGGCGVHAPSRPTLEDGTANLDLVWAVRALDIGVRLGADAAPPPDPPLGLDLDNVCTCPGPESCKARAGASSHCDDLGGRDNSGSRLLKNFAQVSQGIFNQDQINQRIANGEFSLLVHVRGYNGGANDAKVELSIFISQGTPFDDGGATRPTPKWNGADVWIVDSASVFGGANDAGVIIPNYVDTEAFVADHVLVASVDFPLTLGSGGNGILTLELTGSVVTARLVPDGNTFRLEQADLAGRWATSKLLRAVSALHDPVNPGEYVCPGSQTYQNIKALICRAADIVADSKQTDMTQSCDALSIGIGFIAGPAKLGPVQPRQPTISTCPDSGPDDCL